MITLRYDDATVANVVAARERLRTVFADAGVGLTIPGPFHDLRPGSSVHYGGSVRMHASPEFGVLDGWNRIHDVAERRRRRQQLLHDRAGEEPDADGDGDRRPGRRPAGHGPPGGGRTVTATRQPRVAIVIPTYNAEAYVRATLDSVVAQTFTDWALVVFDDGSTDGTVDVATSVAAADDRVLVLRGANEGVAAARNRGFAATDPGHRVRDLPRQRRPLAARPAGDARRHARRGTPPTSRPMPWPTASRPTAAGQPATTSPRRCAIARRCGGRRS